MNKLINRQPDRYILKRQGGSYWNLVGLHACKYSSLPVGCVLFLLFFSFVFLSCSDDRKDDKIVTPWGEVTTENVPGEGRFTVSDIVSGGELIALTMTGPNTYYDYHGRGMGTQYLLCERFARRLGVSLRIEVCRDTAEMLNRLAAGDGTVTAAQIAARGRTEENQHACSSRPEGGNSRSSFRRRASSRFPASLRTARRSRAASIPRARHSLRISSIS